MTSRVIAKRLGDLPTYGLGYNTGTLLYSEDGSNYQIPMTNFLTASKSFDVGFTITSIKEEIVYGGQRLVWTGTYPKTVPSGSTPDTTGGIGSGAWAYSNDSVLRENLRSSETPGATLVALANGTLNDAIKYLTPEMFGAVGDGVTDDAICINNAIIAARAMGVTIVQLSKMHYIGQSITVPEGITLRGGGGNCGLICSLTLVATNNIISVTGNNVTIKDFKINFETNGTGSITTFRANAVNIAPNLNNCVIENLVIDGNYRNGNLGFAFGISIMRPGTNHRILNNVVVNCSVGIYGGGRYLKITGNHCSNHFVDSDSFPNSWNSTSMYWDGFMFEGIQYSNIAGNTAVYNGQSGIYFGGGGSSVSSHNTISNNVVMWNYNQGIDLGVTGTVSGSNDVFNNTINGNVCENNRYNQIWLGTVHHCTVTGNICRVTDAHTTKFASTSDNSGIGLRQTNTSCVIADNVIEVTSNQYSSLYMRGTNCTVSGNRIAGKGMYIDSTTSNNQFNGLSGTFTPTVTGTGMTLISGTGTYEIKNNRISYVVYATIAAASASGSMVLGNLPFITSATILNYAASTTFSSGLSSAMYTGTAGFNTYVNTSGITIAANVAGVAQNIGSYLGTSNVFRVTAEVIFSNSTFTGLYN